MVIFNCLSIPVFLFILFQINKRKSFIGLYVLAFVEVSVHQILADYFLGNYTNFHWFILLMGFIAFLVFKNRFGLSLVFTSICFVLFAVLENLIIPGTYTFPRYILIALRHGNFLISLSVIFFTILIYTHVVESFEKSLESKNLVLENEIKMASKIQKSFFKTNVSGIKNFDVSYYTKPMAGVSGDIYDFYKTNDMLEGVGIFDVSGHGISSGLVTMLVKNIIHQEFYKGTDLELWEILNNINDRVIEEKGNIENYITGVLVRVGDGKLEIASAGHPMPILHKKNGDCQILKQKQASVGAIGIPDIPVFYYSEFIDFEPGDELVLYSDGVTDVENEEGKYFGIDSFINAIDVLDQMPAKDKVKILTETIAQFRGTKDQTDDVTFIVLKKS